ncbi:MAG: FAD-dependent oxidoreductase, partial [Chloroflexota bacterium]
MAKVAVIGAGFAGHTAALYLGDKLGKNHEVTMINKFEYFHYIPSWVWVGIGRMPLEKTRFKLKPVYDKMNVNFVHGKATELHPDEQYVLVENRNGNDGISRVDYDYLVIATGPRLAFENTKGLGPDHGHTNSICTGPHAESSRDNYLSEVARMQKGEKRKFVIGTGHPGATCQGAAFEYISNIHKDLIRRGVRDKAELHWLSNEQAVGDFGVRGVHIKQGGKPVSSEDFIKAVFKEYDIHSQVQAGVLEVNEN